MRVIIQFVLMDVGDMSERREVGSERPVLRVWLFPIECPAGVYDVLQLGSGILSERELSSWREVVEVAIDLFRQLSEVLVAIPELVEL